MHSIWKGELRMSMPIGQTRNALLAVDAVVGGVLILDQERAIVGEQTLEVAVRAHRGAELLAHKGEVKEGDEGDRGPADATRGRNAESQLAGLHEVANKEVANKDDRQQDAAERDRGIERGAEIFAEDTPQEDAHQHHHEHQEHHGEEDDAELADPKLLSEEVESLRGDVEADDVDKG
jgi:hypothetical protein